MRCTSDVSSESASEFNALPEDWASDPVLIADLTVEDDDEHDDPVLRWPDGRIVDTWREDYPYSGKMPRAEYEYLKRPLQVELVKLQIPRPQAPRPVNCRAGPRSRQGGSRRPVM
jgi:hypothetical protein